MRTQQIGIIFFVLSSAGLTFGQSTTPTGIQRIGVIGLLRAEGKIAIGSTPPVETITDRFSGAFVSIDYTNYTPPALPPVTTIGPCIMQTITLPAPAPTQISSPAVTPLDAGPVLNINGPNGAMQVPKMSGFYGAQVGGGTPLPFPIPGLPGLMPLYLDPGSYTIDNGGGGADIGPFTATMNVPSPGFVWTNADADLTIVRSAGVDIQFSGGDPNGMVEIQGTASTSTMSGSFTCIVPNNGDFFVTSDVLSALPASAAGPGGVSILSVSNTSITNFSASGVDSGILSYEGGFSRTVVFQ
jgi:hypothetical protein